MLDKIKRTNVYRSANPYIYVNQPIDTKLYDGLYEQWDRPTHKRWQDFFDVNKVKVTFNEVFKQHKNDTDEKYVGYWFFKDRSDKRPIHIKFHTTNKLISSLRKSARTNLMICYKQTPQKNSKKR